MTNAMHVAIVSTMLTKKRNILSTLCCPSGKYWTRKTWRMDRSLYTGSVLVMQPYLPLS